MAASGEVPACPPRAPCEGWEGPLGRPRLMAPGVLPSRPHPPHHPGSEPSPGKSPTHRIHWPEFLRGKPGGTDNARKKKGKKGNNRQQTTNVSPPPTPSALRVWAFSSRLFLGEKNEIRFKTVYGKQVLCPVLAELGELSPGQPSAGVGGGAWCPSLCAPPTGLQKGPLGGA